MDYDTIRHAPETKAVDLGASAAFDDFMAAFEAFRETNDRRLAEIERRAADPLTEEQLARIDRALDTHKAALDRLQLSAGRPPLAEPDIDADRRHRLRAYTVATLPPASPAGQLIYVSDGADVRRLAVSDGTGWRFPDGDVVA